MPTTDQFCPRCGRGVCRCEHLPSTGGRSACWWTCLIAGLAAFAVVCCLAGFGLHQLLRYLL